MKHCRLIPFLVMLLCSIARAEDVKISVLVFGPGPESWQRYGHIALRVNPDPRYQDDICYDWGRFDFNEPGFIGRFLIGDLRYWMGAASTSDVIHFYRNELDRTITEYELDLTDQEVARLITEIARQDNDANRFYQYDYYRNNCSTAIRDVIDVAVGGRLNQSLKSSVPGTGNPFSTYRSETRRLMPVGLGNRLLMIGMDIGLGAPADRPLSAFEESFVPMRLGEHLEKPLWANWNQEDTARLLVKQTRVLNVTKSPGNFEPNVASNLVGIPLVIGLLGAIKLILFRNKKRLALITLGAWSLVAIAMSTFLVGGWFFTDHWVMRGNPNVLLFSPLWILVLVGIVWKRARHVARWSMLIIGGMTIVSLIHGILSDHQTTWPALALALPINVVGAIVLWTMSPKLPVESTDNQSTVGIN